MNADLDRAIVLIKTGEKAAARNILEKVVALNRYDETAWRWLGVAQDSLQEWERVLTQFIAIRPDSPNAQEDLAFIRRHTARDEEIYRRNAAEITRPIRVQKSAGLPFHEIKPADTLHNALPAQSTSEPTQPIRVNKITRNTPAFSTSVQHLLRWLGEGLLILAVIAFLTQLGLLLAQDGRKGLPVDPLGVVIETLQKTGGYLTAHPSSYLWHKEIVPVFNIISDLFLHSAALLLLSLAVAVGLGSVLGVLAAWQRRRGLAAVVLLTSILGVSTPSFLLAMLFWVLNVQIMRWLQIGHSLLPPSGFGWDKHLVMPVLVLSVRPLAQVMQITYITLSQVLDMDFIRVAQAKGLSAHAVLFRHALKNTMIPILNTMGISLRFSLASLPVVESFFLWEGVGMALVQAITLNMDSLVTDLVITLGFFFIAVNLLLEFIRPLLDPRLQEGVNLREDDVSPGAGRWWRGLAGGVKDSWSSFRQFFKPDAGRKQTASQPVFRRLNPAPLFDSEVPYGSPHGRRLKNGLANPLFWIGALGVLALLLLAISGNLLSAASPYETHGVMMVDGKIHAPPFPPSAGFPWGSDLIGRDIQALVFSGARQTLSLAFFATIARMALGVIIGLLAGWNQRRLFDRLVSGLTAVWAAFPATLFAMILILGLGIQKGLNVFVVALCVIGWSEIAQFVRGQVITQKPMLYVEAARSVGADSSRILFCHILPNLIPSLVVLTVLEMGSVLMLLAELGFLNIFLGGGFKAEIAEAGFNNPVAYYFSDVPEWGSMLASIRNWWRSYPWLAWYPGLFFFSAILALNLFGEGLRRFIDESRISLRFLSGRFALGLGIVITAALIWVFRSSSPIELYYLQGQQFDAARAAADIDTLSSPEFQGRESGTEGARLAAEYIARRMEQAGLFPAGDANTYIQTRVSPQFHLAGVPTLEILDGSGKPIGPLVYRQDFVEYTGEGWPENSAAGHITGLAVSPRPLQSKKDRLIIRSFDYEEKVFILFEEDWQYVDIPRVSGVLLISTDPAVMQQGQLYPKYDDRTTKNYPIMIIAPEAADRLLESAGSSLAELEAMKAGLPMDQHRLTGEGPEVRLTIPSAPENLQEEQYNVIGFIPGIGTARGQNNRGLDSQVIMVSANFDGLGISPDGILYPGANDNASGVAAMLEIARVLKEGAFQPEKTLVFTAWGTGERKEGLSLVNVMGAKRGFNELTVEAVIEISGVAAGSGEAVVIEPDSSARLMRLFQQAARRVGVASTARGRGPHFEQLVHPGFGDRKAMSLYLAWDGSDQYVHTPEDNLEMIDLDKLQRSGEAGVLTLTVLSRETEY